MLISERVGVTIFERTTCIQLFLEVKYMEKYGVFIGRDAELVRTDLYEIVIRRSITDGSFYLEAGLSRIHEDGKELAALCQMNKSAQTIKYAVKCESRNKQSDVSNLFIGNDQELLSRIGKQCGYIEKDSEDGIVVFV
jgi:hypothetical protein